MVPLEGGYLTGCVFYKVCMKILNHSLRRTHVYMCMKVNVKLIFLQIAPVTGTNTFFIVVDVERSSDPLCTAVSCPCNPVSN